MVLKLMGGGKPTRDTTGHLESSLCHLQPPTATWGYNSYYQQVQEDISKEHSENKDWEFVSKGTEISQSKIYVINLGLTNIGSKGGREKGERLINLTFNL
jgi:hypothetical protein